MTPLFRRISLALCALVALGCQDAQPTTGSLVLSISGLPAGAMADVSVTGPNSFVQLVPTTTTIDNLPPGEYTVNVRTATFSSALYASTLREEKRTITAGATETSTIPYSLASGVLDLSISGLPVGAGPKIQLHGPSGFSRSVLASGTIGTLPPGQYTIRSDTITSPDGDRYGTNSVLQTVTIPASVTPVSASVAFALVSGSLTVTIDGIPASQTPPPVTVTGPGGFVRNIASSSTFRGLNAGTYTISAATSGHCPNIFRASEAQQTANVTIGATVSRNVTYTQPPPAADALNLKIEAAHLIQVTQDYQGTVPMIAGRRALLRVFGIANQCNTATPKVRVTLSNGTVVNVDAGAGEASVRITANQGVLVSSWNVLIPDTAVKSGLTFVAEIDPDNTVAEADEQDNRFPATGVKAVAVRTMTPTGIRMVPVTVSATNQTGNVHAGNVDQFLALSRKIHPVHSYDVDVRQPYTTSREAFQANNQNGSWGAVLNEIRALRIADSSARYYYGVVKVSYNSGVAGIGVVGGKYSLGWDHLPSASPVMAHELGHNFGRFHTPCGNPGGVDEDWPDVGFYLGGFIGTYGYDHADGTIKSPQVFTDVMGYCDPYWISDFTYVGMLSWLTDPNRGPTLPIVASDAMQPSLLVWGRIVNGEPVLEPAFEINAWPEMPARGPNRLVATDDSGAELFALSFAGDRVADLPGDNETFAFTIPKSALRGRALGSLAFTARGKTARSSQSADVAADARTTISRTGPRAVRVQWDAARFPVVMVRDPVRGQVLSFARGGDATIQTPDNELELVYSNRVRSARRLVRVR